MSEVQAMQNEGGEGAGAVTGREAGRLGEGPERVNIVLRGGGWVDIVARVSDSWASRSNVTTPRGVVFTRVDIGTLALHHAPAVLVLQGMLLQDLFMPDTFFVDQNTGLELARGPWVFLRGTLGERWRAPLSIHQPVLAALTEVPPNLSRDEVLSELLQAVT